MADARIDTRTPEEIAAAQKSLVKILAVATGIPVIWVTLLAVNGFINSADAPVDHELFYWYVVIWGGLSPVVWLVCNGYTWNQINRGNMEAGRFLPLMPALWIITWFASQLAG
ncbi:MAG: hypothetical protein NUV50_06610 [Rhodospirillales bacterium]|nr:hypothetical protein [Rhodospirillales bacterium]